MPNILILDEPLSGVDIEGQTGLMDMLDEIRRDYDLSILMTTHDFSMLSRYADRVVLIDHEVKCQGTPEEVLDSPQFRAAFRMKEGK
jgi:zinc transport system ATP-binding protein